MTTHDRELTGQPLHAGDSPRDSSRYGAFDLDSDSTVIYDTENEAAWIQAATTAPLDGVR
jgi:hypothetical protein